MKNLVIIPILLLTLVISMFTSCKPKKDDPQPDNKDTTNPVNKLPVANFTFASETINLKDDSVAVNVTNTSTNATSWYYLFEEVNAAQPFVDYIKKTTGSSASCYYNNQSIGPMKVILVAKNAKGDSSYTEKTFTIIDSRLKINISTNLSIGENLAWCGIYVNGKNYDADNSTIKLPWHSLNSPAIISFQTNNLGNGNTYISKSFQLTKDGTNIVLTTAGQTTPTISVDGVNLFDH